MNSRNSGGKASLDTGAAADGDDIRSSNGKSIEESGNGRGSPEVNQLSYDMADTSIDSTRESDWGKFLKKSVATGPESWGSWNHTERMTTQSSGDSGEKGMSPQRHWAHATDSQSSGYRGNSKPEGQKSEEEIISNFLPQEESAGGYDSDDDESAEDPDDDLSDHYDSDASQKSHEMRKNNRWFRAFFEAMDSLKIEQLNEETRRWHCPACHDGPGAIGWYKGPQRLMAHAKTRRSLRVKLHREFAELLEEELQRREIKVIPAGEAFSGWKGLHESTTDFDIVWPPMVVILNTLLKKADNDEWLGISSQELREYFKEYAVLKARHSYSPNGHRRMSVLIFEASAIGYWEAEHLHKHFVARGRGRDAWEQCPMKSSPCAGWDLYGFLAHKEDMDIFNQHSQGRSHLKFEMGTYQKMVVIPMRQMRKDNQTLLWFKNMVVQQQQRLKYLEETLGELSQKLCEETEEDRVARLIAGIQLDECKKEVDSEKRFTEEQIDRDVDSGTNDDHGQRDEDFEAKKERLIGAYEAKKADLVQKQLTERRELDQEFSTAFAEFREKRTS